MQGLMVWFRSSVPVWCITFGVLKFFGIQVYSPVSDCNNPTPLLGYSLGIQKIYKQSRKQTRKQARKQDRKQARK